MVRRREMAGVGYAVLFAALLLSHSSTRACANCTLGDPSITTFDDDGPYRERKRGMQSFRLRSFRLLGEDKATVSEIRIGTGFSYAPYDWLVLSGVLPTVWHHTKFDSGASEDRFGLGDFEIRARFVLRRRVRADRESLFTFALGTYFPTAEYQKSRSIPAALQFGYGTFAAIVGGTFQGRINDVTTIASARLIVPAEGFDGLREGPSLRGLVRIHYQASIPIALRVGADIRGDFADDVQGPNGEGQEELIALTSFGVIITPIPKVSVLLEVGLRAFETHNDAVEEALVSGNLAVTLEFD